MIEIKIGFFDSGIGGLSVLHHAMNILRAEYIFFADEDNVPYGTKSRDEVLQFVDIAFEFLTSHHVDAIVVACNTATSVAVQAMRDKYTIPIIGMEPAVKKALELCPTKKILVIATPITVNGDKMHKLLDKFDKEHRTELLALPKLVDFAERMEFNTDEVKQYLQENFSTYDFQNFGALVLGCTHFNYFKDSLREILPTEVKLIDGNDGTINELIRQLGQVQQTNETSIEYYFSSRPIVDEVNIKRIDSYLNRLNEMEKIG